MSEFETTAVLDLEIPESELRNVRQQIESSIGTTEVGVTDGGTMSAQAAEQSGGGRERRRRRREFRWARERTEYLEDILEEIRGLEPGGGGGGILAGILGGAGDLGGGLATGAATGIGAAVGTAVGNAISGSSVTIDDADIDTELTVSEPEWHPLSIQDPEEWTPLAVDHPDHAYDVDHPEDPYALDHPTEPYALDHPSEPYAVEDPSPIRVERPTWKVPVAQPDPIQVQINAEGHVGGGGATEEITVAEDWQRRFVEEGPLPGFIDLNPEWGQVHPDDAAVTREVPIGGTSRDRAPNDRGSGNGGVSVTVEHQNDVQVGDVIVDAEVSHSDLDRELQNLERDVLDDVERMVEDAMDRLRRDIRGR